MYSSYTQQKLLFLFNIKLLHCPYFVLFFVFVKFFFNALIVIGSLAVWVKTAA